MWGCLAVVLAGVPAVAQAGAGRWGGDARFAITTTTSSGLAAARSRFPFGSATGSPMPCPVKLSSAKDMLTPGQGPQGSAFDSRDVRGLQALQVLRPGVPCSNGTACTSGACLGGVCCLPGVDFSCVECNGLAASAGRGDPTVTPLPGACTSCARLFVLVNNSICVGERYAPCLAHAACTEGLCINSRCAAATASGRVSLTSLVVALAAPALFLALATCGLVCRPIGKTPPPPRTCGSCQCLLQVSESPATDATCACSLSVTLVCPPPKQPE
jgi:hypothetical protein